MRVNDLVTMFLSTRINPPIPVERHMQTAFDIFVSSKRLLPRQGLVRVNFIGAIRVGHKFSQH